MVNETNCTTERAVLGSSVEDSILMPDPLPATISSSLSTSMTTSGSKTAVHSGSVDSFSFPAGSAGTTSGALGLSMAEETPILSSFWKGGSLAKLHAPRNFNDDMEVFSPLVDVHPFTPSLDELWDDHEGLKNNLDKKSLLYPSFLRSRLPAEGVNENCTIFDLKSSSLPNQEDISSLAQLSSTPISSWNDDSSSVTPEGWGGERLSDRLTHLRQSGLHSRFAISTSVPLAAGTNFSGLQDTFPATQSISSLTSSALALANLCIKENANDETSLGSSQHVPSSSTSFSLGTKDISGQCTLGSLGSTMPSNAERTSTTLSFSDGNVSVGSPITNKTRAETREELSNSLLSRSGMSSATTAGVFQAVNGEITQSQKPTLPELQQGPFQSMQEETLSSPEKSNREYMRNLHLDMTRQSHVMQENQAELMKQVQLLRREVQQLRQYIQYIFCKL